MAGSPDGVVGGPVAAGAVVAVAGGSFWAPAGSATTPSSATAATRVAASGPEQRPAHEASSVAMGQTCRRAATIAATASTRSAGRSALLGT